MNRLLKNSAITMTAANIIAWGLFTLGDYYEELRSTDFFYVLVFYAAPIIVSLLYILLRGRIYKDGVNLKAIAVTSLSWIMISVIFFLVISYLVLNEMWIITQTRGGWEHFLNGIEYPLFGIFFAAIPLIVGLLCELILYIIMKIKSRK